MRGVVLALLAISIAGCAARTNAPQPGAPQPGAGPLVVGPHSPYAIAIGPDNNIWFTEYQGDSIGMMTPMGEVMRFPIAPDGIAERLTGGPDGALWFTDPKGNRIGRIAIDGKIKYLALPTPECGPTGITIGADGLIYFTEHGASRWFVAALSILDEKADFARRANPQRVAATFLPATPSLPRRYHP